MAAARRCYVRLMTPKINTPICSLTRAIVASTPQAREERTGRGGSHFFLCKGPSIFRLFKG